MSPDTLATILLAVFLALFLLTLLAFIAGFIKGFYKTTVKTILLAVLVTVFLFVTPTIANAVGNIDLSNFNVNINFAGSVIPLTTIQETLANIITSTGYLSPMNGIAIYQTAIALSTSLIAYVTFFVLVLLTQLFIWLLTAIVYNGIFRWFLPVENSKQRRERKERSKAMYSLTDGLSTSDEEEDEEEEEDPGFAYAEDFDDEDVPDGYEVEESDTRKRLPLLRFPGAILGACGEFVLAMVLVSPITALGRTALSNRETLEPALAQAFPDQAEDISAYLDVVADSQVFKLLGFNGFDTKIMSRVSRVNIGGQMVSFNDILASMLDVANPLISSDAITFGSGSFNVTVNYSKVLDSAMIHDVITAIIANRVIMALIPPLIDIGVNLATTNVPLAELDLTNIDWSDELTAIDQAYASLASTGLLSTMLSDDGKQLNPGNFSIPVATWSEEEYQKNLEAYVAALAKLGDLEVMKKNLPIVFSSLSHTLSNKGYDILPAEPEDYANVDWGHDLALLGKTALSLCRVLDLDISADTKFDGVVDDLVEKLKNDEILEDTRSIVLGETGATDVLEQGLLDMDLLNVVSIPDLLDSSLSAITPLRPYTENLDFSVFDDMTVADLQNEFATFFDMADLLFGEDIDITQGLGGIDFTDQKVADTFTEILNLGEHSKIFTEMYPDIIRTFLFNSKTDISDYLYGLSAYDFNFSDESFTSDFKRLVSMMPSFYHLYTTLTDNSLGTKEKFEQIEAETIGDLLTIVAESEFFNPAQSSGIAQSAAEGRSFNVYVVLKNVFANKTFSDLGFVAPSEEDVASIRWNSSQGDGEIDKIVSLIQNAQKNIGFFLDTNNGTIEDKQALKEMLQTGFDSTILEPSILSIIDTSMNDYLSKLGINKTINQMRTELWKEDIDEIVDILTLAGELDLTGDDFFDTVNPDTINAMLTALYRTNFVANCFGTPLPEDPSSASFVEPQRDRNFSELLITLLEKQDLFGKIGIDNFNAGVLYLSGFSKSTEEATIGKTEGKGGTYLITTSGEIRGLCDLLSDIKEVGIDNLSNNNLPENFLNDLSDECISSKLVRGLLTGVLESAMTNLDGIDEDYKPAIRSIDFSVLVDMDNAQFRKEMSLLDHLYRLSQTDETLGDTKLNIMFKRFLDMDDAMLDEFTSLLSEMGQSHLMTTPSVGTNISPLGEMLRVAFRDNDINGKPLIAQITMAPDESKYDSYFFAILGEITFDEWETEMTNLGDFLRTARDLGLTTGGSFSDIFSDASKKEKCTQLLELLNGSALFHRLPIYIFKENIYSTGNTSNLASLFKDPNGVLPEKAIDFYVHLDNTDQDVRYWNNEIEHGTNLLFSLGNFLESGFENATFGENGIDLAILYDLGSMDLLKDVRSNIVLNLILQTASQANRDLVSGVFKDWYVYMENVDVARLEHIFFANPALTEKNPETGLTVMNRERTVADTGAVSAVLNTILDNLSLAANGDVKAIADNIHFEDLTNSCFYLYEGAYERSALASELVAGIMAQVGKNEQLKAFLPSMSEEQIYGSDMEYPMVNPIEGRAIDSLIRLGSEQIDGTIEPFTKEEMIAILEGLSIQEGDLNPVYALFASGKQYESMKNASIALMEVTPVGSDPKTMKDVLGFVPYMDDQGRVTFLSSLSGWQEFDPATEAYSSFVALL